MLLREGISQLLSRVPIAHHDPLRLSRAQVHIHIQQGLLLFLRLLSLSRLVILTHLLFLLLLNSFFFLSNSQSTSTSLTKTLIGMDVLGGLWRYHSGLLWLVVVESGFIVVIWGELEWDHLRLVGLSAWDASLGHDFGSFAVFSGFFHSLHDLLVAFDVHGLVLLGDVVVVVVVGLVGEPVDGVVDACY